jgi:hypothetical protein
MNGIEIARRVYERLRRPSDTALPWKTILRTLSEVVAGYKIDLALSEQNSLAITSDWFTPSSTDFPLEDLGLEGPVLFPVRVERKARDSELETGHEVPIVNYSVLNTSINGAISFYGDPMRIAFRDTAEYTAEQQYRIIYETDFTDNVTGDSGNPIALPEFFAGMLSAQVAFMLVDQVENDAPEWMNFVKMTTPKLVAELAQHQARWERYVQKFKGKAQVPKRTFFQNQYCGPRTRYFKG